ncbi:hypothetical protein Cni_G17773 [Canna indica]|uniref:Uncharacterized protein n=1 Tax=Canna indica TaxID=4628 RepID=A0AAQ3KJS7_9LILI|nr:hypothetical protein Cni_G17773 [Canna indica]
MSFASVSRLPTFFFSGPAPFFLLDSPPLPSPSCARSVDTILTSLRAQGLYLRCLCKSRSYGPRLHGPIPVLRVPEDWTRPTPLPFLFSIILLFLCVCPSAFSPIFFPALPPVTSPIPSSLAMASLAAPLADPSGPRHPPSMVGFCLSSPSSICSNTSPPPLPATSRPSSVLAYLPNASETAESSKYLATRCVVVVVHGQMHQDLDLVPFLARQFGNSRCYLNKWRQRKLLDGRFLVTTRDSRFKRRLLHLGQLKWNHLLFTFANWLRDQILSNVPAPVFKVGIELRSLLIIFWNFETLAAADGSSLQWIDLDTCMVLIRVSSLALIPSTIHAVADYSKYAVDVMIAWHERCYDPYEGGDVPDPHSDRDGEDDAGNDNEGDAAAMDANPAEGESSAAASRELDDLLGIPHKFPTMDAPSHGSSRPPGFSEATGCLPSTSSLRRICPHLFFILPPLASSPEPPVVILPLVAVLPPAIPELLSAACTLPRAKLSGFSPLAFLLLDHHYLVLYRKDDVDDPFAPVSASNFSHILPFEDRTALALCGRRPDTATWMKERRLLLFAFAFEAVSF